MKEITANEIAKESGGVLLSGSGAATVTSVSIDSRSAKSTDVFFAIKGEHQDAHDYLGKLTDGSCGVIVISDESKVPGDYVGAVIKVADTTKALHALAGYYRDLIGPKVVGITGSVGKTLLKDMTALVLGMVYNVHSTMGNFNNTIGLPLTILSMPANTELLVLEMGMDHAGEIAELVSIARPDVCAITNIGVAHMENFDSREGIFSAKMEIVGHFQNGNTLVINGDDERLRGLKEKYDAGHTDYAVAAVMSETGSETNWDYLVKNPHHKADGSLSFELEDSYENASFCLPPNGLFAAMNAAMATAIGSVFDVSMEDAADSLKDLSLAPHRLHRIDDVNRGITIIDDTYNASPDSMKAGITYLLTMDCSRRIAVLGDMNELGSGWSEFHEEVGAFAASCGLDALFTFGEKARSIASGAKMAKTNKQSDEAIDDMNIRAFDSKGELIDFLMNFVKEGDALLIKGSRGIRMEEVVEAFTC